MNGNFFWKIRSRRILNLLALSSWIAHIYGEFWIHSIHLLECGTLCLLTCFAEKYDNLEEPGIFKHLVKEHFVKYESVVYFCGNFCYSNHQIFKNLS